MLSQHCGIWFYVPENSVMPEAEVRELYSCYMNFGPCYSFPHMLYLDTLLWLDE